MLALPELPDLPYSVRAPLQAWRRRPGGQPRNLDPMHEEALGETRTSPIRRPSSVLRVKRIRGSRIRGHRSRRPRRGTPGPAPGRPAPRATEHDKVRGRAQEAARVPPPFQPPRSAERSDAPDHLVQARVALGVDRSRPPRRRPRRRVRPRAAGARQPVMYQRRHPVPNGGLDEARPVCHGGHDRASCAPLLVDHGDPRAKQDQPVLRGEANRWSPVRTPA
jgi:hypothetical protein